MKKYNKWDYFNIFICMVLFFIVYLFVLRKGIFFYGSTMDYANQHYMIPEYIRTLFYDTKDFFPSLALNLGMGQNIYNFSYYGLFNPYILFSYLFPFVRMVTYLNIVSIFIILFDIVLFYYWISRNIKDKKMRFIATFMFTCAGPIIFHSHRHIMFTNYMPFLLLGLIGTEEYVYRNKKVMLMLSLLFIITSSYFFSIPSFIAMFIYAVFLYLKKNDNVEIKSFIKTHFKLVYYYLIPILMGGVLLVPSFIAILNSRFKSADTLSILSLLVPDVSFKFLLYGSYSMGLTAVFIIAMVNAVLSKEKPYKFLGYIFLLFLIFPVLSYVLNGFMYLNGKVFIPFIPLGVVLIIKLINDVKNKNIRIIPIVLIVLFISILGCFGMKLFYVYIIDIILTLFALFMLYKRDNLKVLFGVVIVVCSFTLFIVNSNDKLADREILDNQYSSSIEKLLVFNDDNLYRTVDVTNELYNANNIRNINEYKTTMYSSLTNREYKNFYWNLFDTENPNRNDAIFSDISNPLFNIYFGNKYYLSNGDAPIGYRKIKEEGNIKLYQNDDVFSLGYASSNLMSEEDYDKLSYPYNVDAILNNTIVSSKVDNVYQTKVKEISTDIYNIANARIENDKYIFDLKDDKDYTINRENVKDKLLIIKFKMNYSENCKVGDTSITINGVSNKLTCKGWKYHNKNYDFTYVISPSDELRINIVKGKYVISDVKLYEMDYNNVKNIRTEHDEFLIDKEQTKGDIIKGSIDVKNDNSYFNLSIPFDKGYNIYVDGKEVFYEKINKSFIGFKINKGYHNIEIKYTSPGLNVGKILSIVGIILFVVTIVVGGKNEENINDRSLL